MDLGLDYCRVLLALGFVSSRFCTPKSAWPVGVIGVAARPLAGSMTGYGLPDMQYHHAVAISHVASSRGMVHLCAASASSVRMRQPLLVVYFCMRKHMSATVYKCSTPQRTRHQARVDASVESVAGRSRTGTRLPSRNGLAGWPSIGCT